MRMFGGKSRGEPSAEEVGGGSTTAHFSDAIMRFASVVNSTLSSRTGMVQLSIVGIAGADYVTGESDPADLVAAESTNDAEQYSALGIIGRPLPPRNVDGYEIHTDVIALKTADGLVPFAYRDVRVKMGGNAPGEGTLAFVGYGGGFHAITPVVKGEDPAGGGAVQTIYCPYDFDSKGVAQKAHAIILDPTDGNESIMVVHSSGLALTMFDGALVMKNKAGDATFRLDDDGITMTAKQIVLSGGVIVGEPATAVPLLAGPASPGSSKFYVSP